MSSDCREAGHRVPLIKRWKKTLATIALVAGLGLGAWVGFDSPAVSGGETRTLSLYHVHTGESLTITYMKDGKYIPSAMKKINYLMRDWRRNEVITISPKTIDLMWELHADLGSKRPIHIICGYRSPRTNAFLKKIGRNVARKSQHMVGRAIDLYFPDVPTVKIRNSALVRKVGGVGYYRGGGGPTGFIHIDSGNVRHWGPGISASQMAQIMRDYKKTVGARLNRKGMQAVPEPELAVADASAAKLPSQQEGGAKLKGKNKIPLETAYADEGDELASMSADASQAKARVVDQAPDGIVKAYPVPKPRPKPIEVLMMAAVNMKIEPASAPPPTLVERASPSAIDGNAMGVVEAAATMTDVDEPQVADGKGSLTDELITGTSPSVPVIRTISTASASGDLFWWPQQLVFDSSRAERRDGAPQAFGDSVTPLLPGVEDAVAADPSPSLPRLAVAEISPQLAAGKGDMLVVNRDGKGSLMIDAPALKKRRLTLGSLFGN
jgi:uncharacterized protein YcbK (DUF882 family)